MRRFKTILMLILSVICLSCFMSYFTGCSKTPPYEPPEESIIKLSITTKTIYPEDTFVIKLLKDGNELQTTWTIDNSNVAEIDNSGTVTGKSVGKTKIRCVYEEIEYVCDLTVELPAVLPTIEFEKIDANVKVEETQKLVVKSDYEIPLNVEYYAIDESIVSVAKNSDNECLVTGLKIGKTNVVVSYVWKGLTIFNTIEVNVISDVEVVLSKSYVDIDALELSAYGFSNKTALSVEGVYKSGNKITAENITWKSLDEQIATVDGNGKVVGVKAGETYIVAEWIDQNSNVYQGYCKIIVNKCTFSDTDKIIYTEDEIIYFEISTLTEIDGQPIVKDVTDSQNEKTFMASKNENKIVLTDATELVAGDRKYLVEFASVAVNFNVQVCDKKIENVEDVVEFRQNVDKYKYVKLLNNVDIGQTEIGDTETITDVYFSGVFDGQGYTISNGIYKANGLFVNLSVDSIVKNVAFSNSTLYSYEYSETIRNTSIVAYMLKGKIDNVLFDIKVQPIAKWSNNTWTDGRFGSILGSNSYNTTEISNIVVYHKVLSTKYITSQYGLVETGSATGIMHTLINTESGGTIKGSYSNVFLFKDRDKDVVDGITTDVYTINDTCETANLANKIGFNDCWSFDYDKAIFKLNDNSLLRISTAEQLLQFSANPSEYKVVILTADIDLGTNVIGEESTSDSTTYFSGVFDGQGHKIIGGIYKGQGLFTNLSDTSVVKNVGFVEATLYSYAYSQTHTNSSILAYRLKGQIDNVLFDVKVQPIAKWSNNTWTDARFSAILGTYTYETTVITNVIVYHKVLSAKYVSSQYGLVESGSTTGSVHILVNIEVDTTREGTFSNVIVFRDLTNRPYDITNGATEVLDYSTTCSTANLTSKGFNSYWDFSGEKATMVVGN